MALIGIFLFYALRTYVYVLIARMIIGWIPFLAPQWRPSGLIASIFEVVYTLTDPPIRLFRKVIPPLQLGSVSLDLAFMAVLFCVYLLQQLVVSVFW